MYLHLAGDVCSENVGEMLSGSLCSLFQSIVDILQSLIVQLFRALFRALYCFQIETLAYGFMLQIYMYKYYREIKSIKLDLFRVFM